METFVQPKITGYRQLNEAEAALMNEIKAEGVKLGELVAKLRATDGLDQRWVSIGATDLQTGLMALTRGVAQPTHVLSMSASLNLSIRLQAIAQALEDTLNEAAGEPCAFVLVLQADGVAQYVSNADRKDGCELIESLLERWKAGRADIPAHYNPDLRPPQAG